MNRDVFRQTLIEQTTNLTKRSLIKEIDKWEKIQLEQFNKQQMNLGN